MILSIKMENKSNSKDINYTMNILGLFFLIFIITIVLIEGVESKKRYLTTLSPTGHSINANYKKAYGISELKQIGTTLKREGRLKSIPPSLFNRLRFLKIHKKRQRGCRSRPPLLSNQENNNNRGVQERNLIYPQTLKSSKTITILLQNCQSIKNKFELIREQLDNKKINIAILTENLAKG